MSTNTEYRAFIAATPSRKAQLDAIERRINDNDRRIDQLIRNRERTTK